ncbi:hypothetical protein LWQ05_004989 [Salmonella enterica]|nr:hypothetical protein [Salmonella enterica]
MNKSNVKKLAGMTAVSVVLASPLAQMACAGQVSQWGVAALTVAISAAVAVAGLAVTHKAQHNRAAITAA